MPLNGPLKITYHFFLPMLEFYTISSTSSSIFVNSFFLDEGEYDAWVFEVDGIGFLGVDGFDSVGVLVDSEIDSELDVRVKYCVVLDISSSAFLMMASCFSKEIRCSLFLLKLMLSLVYNSFHSLVRVSAKMLLSLLMYLMYR